MVAVLSLKSEISIVNSDIEEAIVFCSLLEAGVSEFSLFGNFWIACLKGEGPNCIVFARTPSISSLTCFYRAF